MCGLARRCGRGGGAGRQGAAAGSALPGQGREKRRVRRGTGPLAGHDLWSLEHGLCSPLGPPPLPPPPGGRHGPRISSDTACHAGRGGGASWAGRRTALSRRCRPRARRRPVMGPPGSPVGSRTRPVWRHWSGCRQLSPAVSSAARRCAGHYWLGSSCASPGPPTCSPRAVRRAPNTRQGRERHMRRGTINVTNSDSIAGAGEAPAARRRGATAVVGVAKLAMCTVAPWHWKGSCTLSCDTKSIYTYAGLDIVTVSGVART